VQSLHLRVSQLRPQRRSLNRATGHPKEGLVEEGLVALQKLSKFVDP
jgi:hypothetical protein